MGFAKTFRPVQVEEVTRVTEKAMCVRIDGEEHWMPKSQCDNMLDEGQSGELLITEWIGQQKGLFESEEKPTTTAGHSAPQRVPDDGIPF